MNQNLLTGTQAEQGRQVDPRAQGAQRGGTSLVTRALNDVRHAFLDAETRYRETAQKLQSDELRTVLLNRAASYKGEAADVERWIADYGGVITVVGRGRISKALHKTWTAARHRLDERSGDVGVLALCVRSQSKLIARLREVTSRELPVPVLTMIHRRLETLQRDFDQLLALRDGSSVS